MFDDDRVTQVKRLLEDYMKSPSLRHIKDAHSLHSLAVSIIERLDRESGIWIKWQGKREAVLKAAAGCWIPTALLQDYLNRLPGPHLTETDVAQRLKALEEEPFSRYPDEDLKEGCLALVAKEITAGTELPAVIGVISDHLEAEQERLDRERKASRRSLKQQQQRDAEERLLTGADCKWTQLRGDKRWHCRRNGRTYRLVATSDRKWDLYYVDDAVSEEQGWHVGQYGTRGDATKAVERMAYQRERNR